MSSLLTTRKAKAATLVPLALLSAAWTASLAGADSSATAAGSGVTDLPDGTTIPSQAITAPASVPIPGSLAAAVPDGAAGSVVSGASASGIPSAALSAYQRAAQIINAADASCNVPWELLAAIGRVESNHGQFGGNTLDADGVSKPGIFGPALNGKRGTQAIADTDGGTLDKDTTYDRAVGPMQFIPSTWSSVKVDADGDGARNPQDIDDASLAAAVYLCSGSENLASRSGQEKAVFRYNHSQPYVDLVLRLMEAYSLGNYTAIPSGTYGGSVFAPSYEATVQARPERKPITKPSAPKPTRPVSGGGGSTAPEPTGPAPTNPATPSTPKNPLSGVTKPLTDTLDSVTGGATKPLTDVIDNLTEALSFCNEQFASIPDPLNLLSGLKSQCAAKVEGMTETKAAAAVPNTLTQLLAWLGLKQ